MNTSKSLALDLPFGRPFASQMSENEVTAGFCNMRNMQFSIQSGSLAFTSRRGGGKTHMLRKLFHDLVTKSGIQCEYEPMSLSTEYVLPELRSFSPETLSQHLKVVWEVVLVLRVARLVATGIRQSGLRPAARKAFLDELEERLRGVGIPLQRLNRTAGIYNEVLPRLSHHHRGPRWLLDSFNRRELIAHLKTADVTAYLFLDDADDEYHESPSFWNVNLVRFYHAISFLRRELPKIHVVTAMRREVYDHMQHSDPNWTRIAGPDNVKDIVWNHDSLRALFEAKVRALPKEIVRYSDRSGRAIESFLGVKEVKATNSRCSPEPILHYILRHTFYRARDLIYMGNAMWRQLRDLDGDQQSDPAQIAKRIRTGVKSAASMVAKELTSECDAVLRDLGPIDLYRLPPTTYLLTRLRSNIVPREQLERALREVERDAPALARLNPYDVLAHWGLIGWVGLDEAGREIQKFNFETFPNAPRDIVLPKSPQYFIHPAVYDLDAVLGGMDRISRDYTVGHGYPAPPKSVFRISSSSRRFTAAAPFRLHWQLPEIIDAKGRRITLRNEWHMLLKLLFGHENIRIVSYETVFAMLQKSRYGTVVEDSANKDWKKQVEQLVRALRRTLKAYGILDTHALVQTVHGRGFQRGSEWHRTRPCTGRGSVREVRSLSQPDLDRYTKK